jgi:hypothetical protein
MRGNFHEFRRFLALFSITILVSSTGLLAIGPKIPLVTFPQLFELRSGIPAFWGPEIIGADLAREAVAPLHLDPVDVIVSDGGVKRGATRLAGIQIPPRPFRTFNLRLLVSTGVGRWMPEIKNRPAFKTFLEVLPTRVLHPIELLRTVTHPTHGTHVAGIIAGGADKFGVSSNAEIEDLNIFAGEGFYRPEAAKTAYEYLLDRPEPVAILNMSHGIPYDGELIRDLKMLVEKRDTLCVAATGNEYGFISDKNGIVDLPECIRVGAFGLSGTKTAFSNYGPSVDIVAPGEFIISRGTGFPFKNAAGELDEYEVMSGTSMATPMVSGTLAILRSILPEAKAIDLREILLHTTFDLGAPGRDWLTGHGLLNTYRATIVALRLRLTGILSSRAIHEAVQEPKTFATAGLAKKLAFITSKSKNLSAEAKRNLIRKQLLLESNSLALEKLGKLYQAEGKIGFGFGLIFAAKNRPDYKWSSPEEFNKFTSNIVVTQAKRIELDPLDTAFIGSIQSPDVLLEVFKKMEAPLALQLVPSFQTRLFEIAPQDVFLLAQLVAEKSGETLDCDQVGVLGKAL